MSVFDGSRWVDDHRQTVWHAALVAYLSATAIYVALRYLMLVPDGGQIWTTGDWLIHYGAGFVRRGLTGTITFALSDLTGLGLTLTAALTQIAVYAAMMATVLFLIARTRITGPVLLIAISPAFLLMPFFSLKLAMCKEMIGFLALALMAATSFTGRRGPFWAGLAVLALSGLAHEINAFLAPGALVMTAIYAGSGLLTRRAALFAAAAILVPAGAAVLLAMAFPGHGLSAEICRQIVERGGSGMFCDPQGPVWWLEKSTADGMHFTWTVDVATSVWPWFVAGYLLSMAPFALFRVAGDATGRRTALVLAGAFLGLVALAPLFVVASDWGRWISMHVFAVTMLTLAALRLGLIEERTTALHPVWLLYGAVWSMTDFGAPLSAGLLDKFIRLGAHVERALAGLAG